MVADNRDEPHRPTTPPHPGWSGTGPLVSEQTAANKLFAYNNAKLRDRDAQLAGEDYAALDEATAGPGRYQVLNSEHEAHTAEIAARAEQIKTEHGVRIAGDLHQRGLADGMMIEGAVNAFAGNAAKNGLQAADVPAMAAEDYDKALATAATQAEIERQAAAGPSAAPSMETRPADGATPPAAEVPEASVPPEINASSELTDARQERFQRLAPEAAVEAGEQKREISTSDLDAFRDAGGEVTESRAARFGRLNDSGPDSPSPEGPTPAPPSPGLGE